MEVHTEKLSLFTNRGISSAVLKERLIVHNTSTQIGDGSFALFDVISKDYIDLSRSDLVAVCQVVKGDGTAIDVITDTDSYKKGGDVCVSNDLASGLFSDIEFSISGTNLTLGLPSGSLPYKSHCDTLVYGCDKEDLGKLFKMDDNTAMGSNSVYQIGDAKDNASVNSSLKERTKYISHGERFTLRYRPPVDLFQQSRLILPMTSMSLKLILNRPEFSLISKEADQNFKIKLHSLQLRLHHVTLQPEVNLAINDALSITPAVYPFESSCIRVHSVSKGALAATILQPFHQTPNCLFVMLVKTSTYHGAYDSPPYQFDHHGLSSLGYFVGNESFPSEPLTPTFNDAVYKSDIYEAYSRLKQINKDSIISLKDFHSGFSIYAFPIAQSNGEGFTTLLSPGEQKLECRFAKALEQDLTVIMYARFSSVLSLDETRVARLN